MVLIVAYWHELLFGHVLSISSLVQQQSTSDTSRNQQQRNDIPQHWRQPVAIVAAVATLAVMDLLLVIVTLDWLNAAQPLDPQAVLGAIAATSLPTRLWRTMARYFLHIYARLMGKSVARKQYRALATIVDGTSHGLTLVNGVAFLTVCLIEGRIAPRPTDLRLPCAAAFFTILAAVHASSRCAADAWRHATQFQRLVARLPVPSAECCADEVCPICRDDLTDPCMDPPLSYSHPETVWPPIAAKMALLFTPFTYSPFTADSTPAPCCMLPCGHFFHAPCLLRWLEWKGTCPTCRADVE